MTYQEFYIFLVILMLPLLTLLRLRNQRLLCARPELWIRPLASALGFCLKTFQVEKGVITAITLPRTCHLVTRKQLNCGISCMFVNLDAAHNLVERHYFLQCKVQQGAYPTDLHLLAWSGLACMTWTGVCKAEIGHGAPLLFGKDGKKRPSRTVQTVPSHLAYISISDLSVYDATAIKLGWLCFALVNLPIHYKSSCQCASATDRTNQD